MNETKNPIRGTLKDCFLDRQQSIVGILISEDLCEGQPGRNKLTVDKHITTSYVRSITAENGNLIANTRNSRYIIEGGINLANVEGGNIHLG